MNIKKIKFHHLIHKQHILTSGFSKRKQRNIPRSGAAAGMPNLKGLMMISNRFG